MKLVIKNKINENIDPKMLKNSAFTLAIVRALKRMQEEPSVLQTGLNVLDSEGRPTIRGYYLLKDGDKFSIYHISNPGEKVIINPSDYI